MRLPAKIDAAPLTDAVQLAFLGQRLSNSHNALGAILFTRALIRRDWRAFLVTIAGSGTAALIAIFQFAVFTSFLSTAFAVPRFLDADIWITGRNVDAFDFPYPIEADRAGHILAHFPGSSFRRILFQFAPWESPHGRRGNVAVVGVEDIPLSRRSYFVDASELDAMDLDPSSNQMGLIGEEPFWDPHPVTGLATFLGIPYVIMNISDAREVLNVSNNKSSYIILDSPEDAEEIAKRVAALDGEYPGISILTNRQFEDRTSTYWMAKTGAGAAIALAAILAALIMVIFLISGISRFCQRYYEDFMTLIGLGYDQRIVFGVAMLIAALLVIGTSTMAFALLPLVETLTTPVVPWVETKWNDILFGVILAAISSLIAWVAVIRQVSAISVDEVFR